MHKVEGPSSPFYYEAEFKKLEGWKKVATFAVVFFASVISIGFLFEDSFRFMVNKLKKPNNVQPPKVKIVDLTKKRDPLSQDEKKQLEEHFEAWKNEKQPHFKIDDKKKIVMIASLYVLHCNKDDKVKFGLIEILENRRKEQEELKKFANIPSPPVMPKSSPKEEDEKIFKEKKKRKNEAGEEVVVKKVYRRLDTCGDGSCGFHALLGKDDNGWIKDNLNQRQDFCKHLEDLVNESSPTIVDNSLKDENGNIVRVSFDVNGDKFPQMLSATLEEMFEALKDGKNPEYLKDYIKVVADFYKANFEKNVKVHSEIEKPYKEKIKKLADEAKKESTALGKIIGKFVKDKKVLEIVGGKAPGLSEKLENTFYALLDKKEPSHFKEHVEALKEYFSKNYLDQSKPIRERELEFHKQIKEISSVQEKLQAVYHLDKYKMEFKTNKAVRKLYLEHLKKNHVYAQVSEIIVAARHFKVPLILHRQGAPSEKYKIGEGIEPEMADFKEENTVNRIKKDKINWVHIFHQHNHFERVVKIDHKILPVKK